jgi:amidohydrolase
MQRSIDAPLSRLLSGIERELPHAVELRHRLHGHPELSHAEEWTAATIARELPVESIPAAGTGRLARIGAEVGRPIAVRAELDGLPIAERTDAPWRAVGGAMHACGHDVHMAALVALARAAHALGEALPAPLLAVFQPSEEAYPSGAEQLVRGELTELAPAAVVAAHVHPELAWGTVALDPGTVNASSDNIEITIEGEPSHGAYPHQGRDPILTIAHVVVALHSQVARRIDPQGPALLTIGVLKGGDAENVIPARARARGSLRAHRPEDRIALRQMVKEVVHGIAAAYGCRGTVKIVAGEPALRNDPAIAACARELLSRADLTAAPEWRSCGSDDFAFFGEHAPLAMGFVGLDGAAGFKARPLHHPELLPPDGAVGTVARVQAVLYAAAVVSLADVGP